MPIVEREHDGVGREARVGSLADLRGLFETSPDLIVIADCRGTFTHISQSSEAILGYRPDEMIGRNGADFIYPEDLDPTRKEMRLARRGRHMRNFRGALRPQERPCGNPHLVGRMVGRSATALLHRPRSDRAEAGGGEIPAGGRGIAERDGDD